MRQSSYNNILIWLMFIAFIGKAFAQTSTEQRIKNRQRAIVIYNFAQQIGWAGMSDTPTFIIGVLGNDPILDELQKVASRRRIHGKPVAISAISSIKAIKNISVLYVNEKFNYDIEQVLKRVSKKRILVISENYQFNSSMINIIHAGDSFYYEMNRSNILEENFTIGKDLSKNAIDSQKKWLELYKVSQQELVAERQTVAEQKETLKEQKVITEKQSKTIVAQKEFIMEQFEKIDTREIRLEKLEIIRDEQRKRFRQKLTLLDSLENFIQQQETHIKLQEEAIELQKKDVEKQSEYIQQQLVQIADQKKILAAQKSEITTKNRQTMLISMVAILALIAGLLIYRSNRIRKRLNVKLKEKNKAIRQKTEELEIQNKEMEQFAYIASHDLQEPLNTISSFINLLSEDYNDAFDDVGKQSLYFIANASKRMKVLITSLLEYSRLGRDKIFEKVSCNTLLENLQKDLSQLIKTSNTKLTVTTLPSVQGNPTELGLLFQNLISNAIKFMPEDRTPEISVSCQKIVQPQEDGAGESFWKFTVTDNGIGIAAKHQEKIFAIFQRLHSKDTYKGTGIGLAHCKKIVEAHGGVIGVVSKENKGSAFWFTIPWDNQTMSA